MAFHVVDGGSAGARHAMSQYVEELLGALPHGFTAEGALEDGAIRFSPPHGVFVVAPDVDRPQVGGAVHWLDEDRAEIKRMWVSPDLRGQGLASLLLAELEAQARAAGRRTVLLDTNSALTSAVRLYDRSGYARVADYNGNADADLWFEKRLA